MTCLSIAKELRSSGDSMLICHVHCWRAVERATKNALDSIFAEVGTEQTLTALILGKSRISSTLRCYTGAVENCAKAGAIASA